MRSVFPSPVLICSVTSDRTKAHLWLPLRLWNYIITAQRVQWQSFLLGSRVSSPLSNSSSRLETFASFGHPALTHLGQCFYWRALWDPQVSIMQARERALVHVLQWHPFLLPSPGETMSWTGICQHKTCYRATQDLCLHYHCKLEPNL